MNRRNVLHLLAALCAAPQLAWAKNFADDPRVSHYIDYLQREHQFVPSELQTMFARLSYNKKVLQLIGAPLPDAPPKKAVKKTYWNEYQKQRLTAKKIVAGIKFYKQHESLLLQAQEKYGIPPHIIVAIIGIETNYGSHTGNYPVAETLATLGFFHPKRGDEFLQELTEFLLYARETRIDPLSISGSYAGAIGIAQFMPSSLRKFAVDYNSDARINLFTPEDAIPSIANFLLAHGWQRKVGISYPANISGDGAEKLIQLTADNDYKPIMDLTELSGYGVRTPAPAGNYVFVDLENRYDNEYRVGSENFYALTRYNRSFKYAAIVTDLAAAIQKKVN